MIHVNNIPVHDNVKHPSHYTNGDIEVIDYMQDKLSPQEFEGYCIGNVIKYTSRYKKKNGVEDLKKARWYLNRAIATYIGEEDLND